MSKPKYNNEAHENRIHSSLLIPYSLYHNIIPDYFSFAPLHKHDEFEINIIYEGIGDFTCEDSRIRAYKGDILIMPCNKLHSIGAYDNYRLVFDTFIFNPEMLGINLKDRATSEAILPFITGEYDVFHIPTTAPYYSEAEASLAQIINSCQKNNAINDVIVKSELLKFISVISMNHTVEVSYEKDINYFDLIKPCIEYINENYMHDITVEKLSEITNLSKSYFMNCFKKAVGYSAIDYVSQVRIKKACDYLLSSDKNISDIAFLCGFNNLSNFNRQFKALNQMTPKEYKAYRTRQE